MKIKVDLGEIDSCRSAVAELNSVSDIKNQNTIPGIYTPSKANDILDVYLMHQDHSRHVFVIEIKHFRSVKDKKKLKPCKRSFLDSPKNAFVVERDVRRGDWELVFVDGSDGQVIVVAGGSICCSVILGLLRCVVLRSLGGVVGRRSGVKLPYGKTHVAIASTHRFNRAVKHPTLHVLHKCENIIFVQVGLLRLQRLMEKPTSSFLVLSAIVCEWFVVHPLVADEFLAANENLRLKETSKTE
ncbi:hypothetical protein OUZ56_017502 [Daphnia magna]|uniref:Uncharacterized protein n=1 Tax=Daphnia magna TaxID=35525 RepID=A0ABR0ASX2_9CRUS|nr:hypothetical protein OUZ56_017502 [Daphnia magna]